MPMKHEYIFPLGSQAKYVSWGADAARSALYAQVKCPGTFNNGILPGCRCSTLECSTGSSRRLPSIS